MKIGVIGSTGVLGRRLVPLLTVQEHDVRSIVRDKNNVSQFGETYQADILQADTLLPAFKDLDVLINLATSIPNGKGRGNWTQNDLIRTVGTKNVISTLDALGGSCRLVQQSVAMLHGGYQLMSEEDELNGTSVLASAVTMEKMVQASSLEWVIVRGGALYGPDTSRDKSYLMRLASGHFSHADHADRWISFVHVDDLVSAFACAVTLPPSQAYIACDDHPITYQNLIETLRDMHEVDGITGSDIATLPSFRTSNSRLSSQNWKPNYKQISDNYD